MCPGVIYMVWNCKKFSMVYYKGIVRFKYFDSIPMDTTVEVEVKKREREAAWDTGYMMVGNNIQKRSNMGD